jgi:hypothetical protein
MKKLILLASIATIGSAVPASAKPGHTGHAAHDQNGPIGYGTGGCPPGLAKKNPRCMPPGQYKKLFQVGQRVPNGYDGLMGYNALPYDIRNQYGSALDPQSRYIYDQGYLYRVDPTTMLVSQVLQALLR